MEMNGLNARDGSEHLQEESRRKNFSHNLKCLYFSKLLCEAFLGWHALSHRFISFSALKETENRAMPAQKPSPVSAKAQRGESRGQERQEGCN